MKLLFDKKIKFDDKEFWLTIYKVYEMTASSGEEYYSYDCDLYEDKKFLMGLKRRTKIFTYRTYWLKYYKYNGNIDKVIEEVIDGYRRKLREEKYVFDKESNFKSKYEI